MTQRSFSIAVAGSVAAVSSVGGTQPMANAATTSAVALQDVWRADPADLSKTKNIVAAFQGSSKVVISDAATSIVHGYGTDYQLPLAWYSQSDTRLLAVESLTQLVSKDVTELKAQVHSLLAFHEQAGALERATVPFESDQDIEIPELRLPEVASVAQSLPAMLEALGHSPVGDAWTATLDYIAEKAPARFPFGGELAALALDSDDAAVRAAAARALAVSAPSSARAMLEPRYEQEKNRAVRAAIDSAMRLCARA